MAQCMISVGMNDARVAPWISGKLAATAYLIDINKLRKEVNIV